MEIIQGMGDIDFVGPKKKIEKLSVKEMPKEEKKDIKIKIIEDIEIKEDDYNV